MPVVSLKVTYRFNIKRSMFLCRTQPVCQRAKIGLQATVVRPYLSLATGRTWHSQRSLPVDNKKQARPINHMAAQGAHHDNRRGHNTTVLQFAQLRTGFKQLTAERREGRRQLTSRTCRATSTSTCLRLTVSKWRYAKERQIAGRA